MLAAQRATQEGRTQRLETTFAVPRFPEPAPGRQAHLVNDRNVRR